MENRTYYDILNVKNTASDKEIKNAFRELIKVWHPDLHPGDQEAVIKTQEINEAYNVLSDAAKRAEYDRTLNPPQNQNIQYEQREYESPKNEEPDKSFPLWGKLLVLLVFATISVSSSYRNDIIDVEEFRLHSVLISAMFILVVLMGVYTEIHRRREKARRQRAAKLGGVDSVIEVERWWYRFANSGISLKECRNDFFNFSIYADQFLLLRLKSLSEEEMEKYKDVIELLENVIEFRLR